MSQDVSLTSSQSCIDTMFFRAVLLLKSCPSVSVMVGFGMADQGNARANAMRRIATLRMLARTSHQHPPAQPTTVCLSRFDTPTFE